MKITSNIHKSMKIVIQNLLIVVRIEYTAAKTADTYHMLAFSIYLFNFTRKVLAEWAKSYSKLVLILEAREDSLEPKPDLQPAPDTLYQSLMLHLEGNSPELRFSFCWSRYGSLKFPDRKRKRKWRKKWKIGQAQSFVSIVIFRVVDVKCRAEGWLEGMRCFQWRAGFSEWKGVRSALPSHWSFFQFNRNSLNVHYMPDILMGNRVTKIRKAQPVSSRSISLVNTWFHHVRIRDAPLQWSIRILNSSGGFSPFFSAEFTNPITLLSALTILFVPMLLSFPNDSLDKDCTSILSLLKEISFPVNLFLWVSMYCLH